MSWKQKVESGKLDSIRDKFKELVKLEAKKEEEKLIRFVRIIKAKHGMGTKTNSGTTTE